MRTSREINLSVYLLTTKLLIERHTYFRNIFLCNAYLLHIMDVGLRKTPCVFLRVIIHFPCF